MINNDKEVTRELVEDYLWRFGEVEFDEPKWELRVHGQALDLEPRPLEVLNLLLRHAGEVVTKDEFFEAVWPGAIAGEKALTNAVAKLRKAIGDEDQSVIETVHKVGYRFVAALTRKVVGRRTVAKLSLKPGDPVPRRGQWQLARSLDVSVRSEVWLAEHLKTREKRVFKFSPDGTRLSSLKREATLSRVLTETLGARPDFVRVLEWNFEEAPYFLECEYGGQDWAAWAESRGGLDKVPMDERLDLFVQAAEAVAAAHSVGVLHKDLKPANLLIEPKKEGGWQVRLTDFGSGKLIDPAALADLGVTRMGFTQTQSIGSDSLTGTPMYLAPEVLAGQAPTQASDLYALGVLLYQIIVGDLKKPISPGWESDISDDLLREDIAASASGNPDNRIKTAADLLERVRTLTQRRELQVEELETRHRLALLQRQIQKAKARRPWAISLSVALAAGMAVSLYFYAGAKRSASQAEHQLQISRALNDFVNKDIIAAANPYDNGGKGDVTVRDAVTKAAQSIGDRFKDQPLVEAEIRSNLGQAFNGLAMFDAAFEQFRRSFELRSSILGSGDVATLEAELAESVALAKASKVDEARQVLDQFDKASLMQKDLPNDLRFRAFNNRGVIGIMTHRYPDAIQAYEAGLAVATKMPALDKKRLLYMKMNLASAYLLGHKFDKAGPMIDTLLQETVKDFGPTHPDTLDVRLFKAQFLTMTNQFDAAYEIARKLNEDSVKTLGQDDSHVGDSLAMMADAASFGSRLDESVDLYSKVYAIRVKQTGADSLYSIEELDNEAVALQRTGRLLEAERTFRQAIATSQKVSASDDPRNMGLQYDLADCLIDEGKIDDATLLARKLDQAQFGANGPPDDWEGLLLLLHGKLLLKSNPMQAQDFLKQGSAKLATATASDQWRVNRAGAELIVSK